ncbi:hypothetical protein AKUA2103_PHAGE100200 (plasmid) [Apilactobacillus kunkeei]|nr:hypothetical protein AKUA2103_PHAGE100200 [Apilactobacillus kunkeei]CAI2699310.1 hypothetical protein AKUA1003_PHAGE100200 [Apilactobacillus kunkeei]
MKTINDLVNKLNNYYDMEFRVANTGDGYCIEDDMYTYICFDNGHWDIISGFCMLHHDVQKEIMDFIYTTDKEHWFDEPEKKYNIVIGKDMRGHCKSAYYKGTDAVKVLANVYKDDLTLDNFIFTESEIEDLKATLPENMAKIIDLGKVEVKDD